VSLHVRLSMLGYLLDIGWTVVRLEDQTFATQVTFAEENEPSLLGVVTLEDALLAVDPVGQRLVPVEAERLWAMTNSNNLDALFTDAELPFGPGDGHLFMEQNALHGSQDELPAILDFQARWPWPSAPGTVRAAVPWPSEWDLRSRGL
jgi:hypothetical protein